MKITLTNAGKRYNRDWIFRNLSYEFTSGQSYAITGPNGSGKSTLLQLIAGSSGISEGTIEYRQQDTNATDKVLRQQEIIATEKVQRQHEIIATEKVQRQQEIIATENVHRHIALAAPYLDLIEEMTLSEFLHFHHQFKPFVKGLAFDDISELVQLQDARHKQIRYFSSGMKQRAKLAQAIFSDTPVLLLDEPCTNLDEPGILLYQQLMETYSQNRLVIVSSNDKQEYSFCRNFIDIQQFK